MPWLTCSRTQAFRNPKPNASPQNPHKDFKLSQWIAAVSSDVPKSPTFRNRGCWATLHLPPSLSRTLPCLQCSGSRVGGISGPKVYLRKRLSRFQPHALPVLFSRKPQTLNPAPSSLLASPLSFQFSLSLPSLPLAGFSEPHARSLNPQPQTLN